ncbi:hypothetical protein FACS1894152_5350 [Bacilli bacterium]|nr:hypothetical protein FACS1894152_5350 [Bacilli bacterium]
MKILRNRNLRKLYIDGFSMGFNSAFNFLSIPNLIDKTTRDEALKSSNDMWYEVGDRLSSACSKFEEQHRIESK